MVPAPVPVLARGWSWRSCSQRLLPVLLLQADLPVPPVVSGAPGGRAGGRAAPPQPPVVLSRNGKGYTLTRANVRAGTEIKVITERPTMNLSLTEMDAGSVIFELPGFSTAASGTQQSSLDALRKASATSYFKDKDALWVKVVSTAMVLVAPLAASLVVEPASWSADKLHPAG